MDTEERIDRLLDQLEKTNSPTEIAQIEKKLKVLQKQQA